MKKFIGILISVLALAAIFAFSGCGNNSKAIKVTDSDTYVVINVSSSEMELTENTTLLNYMEKLREGGKITFEFSNDMITSINGVDNPLDYSKCWMIYTSDKANANASFGEIELKGTIYDMATLGASSLKVKDGNTYIWFFQSFGA